MFDSSTIDLLFFLAPLFVGVYAFYQFFLKERIFGPEASAEPDNMPELARNIPFFGFQLDAASGLLRGELCGVPISAQYVIVQSRFMHLKTLSASLDLGVPFLFKVEMSENPTKSGRDVEVGDAEFDAHACIESEDEEAVAEFLTQNLRRHLLNMRFLEGKVVLTREELVFRADGALYERGELQVLYAQFEAVLKELCGGRGGV